MIRMNGKRIDCQCSPLQLAIGATVDCRSARKTVSKTHPLLKLFRIELLEINIHPQKI